MDACVPVRLRPVKLTVVADVTSLLLKVAIAVPVKLTVSPVMRRPSLLTPEAAAMVLCKTAVPFSVAVTLPL